jgi:hypothetical protein
MATYQPKADTIAARALDAIEAGLRYKPKGAWLPNADAARVIGVRPNAMLPALGPALDAGLVEKSLCSSGFTQWRLLGTAKPRRTRPAKPTDPQKFSLDDWPPGFVAQFDSVSVRSYETRRK